MNFLSHNVLDLKTPSFIFSNLFLISKTSCPNYIYKISPKYGKKDRPIRVKAYRKLSKNRVAL